MVLIAVQRIFIYLCEMIRLKSRPKTGDLKFIEERVFFFIKKIDLIRKNRARNKYIRSKEKLLSF